jgi:hypothetical protein
MHVSSYVHNHSFHNPIKRQAGSKGHLEIMEWGYIKFLKVMRTTILLIYILPPGITRYICKSFHQEPILRLVNLQLQRQRCSRL